MLYGNCNRLTVIASRQINTCINIFNFFSERGFLKPLENSLATSLVYNLLIPTRTQNSEHTICLSLWLQRTCTCMTIQIMLTTVAVPSDCKGNLQCITVYLHWLGWTLMWICWFFKTSCLILLKGNTLHLHMYPWNRTDPFVNGLHLRFGYKYSVHVCDKALLNLYEYFQNQTHPFMNEVLQNQTYSTCLWMGYV